MSDSTGSSSNYKMPVKLRYTLLAGLLSFSALAQVPATPPPPGQVVSSEPSEAKIPADVRPEIPVTDAERSSVEVTSLNLDLHLIPADARE
jgi:hypothetical protein